MNNTTVADFGGVPYVAVDESVTKIVIMRGEEHFTFDLPAISQEQEISPN